MAFKHTLKRGSTRPVLRYPVPGVDLTGASATFLMSPRPGQPATVNAPAVIANGALEYHWQHGDTSAAVMHYGEFEVMFPGGAIETFPADDYIRIEVKQDIGDGGSVAPPALIVLSGALVEAGADMVSGSASVGISLSGAMTEGGSDTASGSLSVVAPGAITLSAALVEGGADTASGEMAVTTPAPTVTVPDDGGNKLGTTASVTPSGEVTITNKESVLNGDLNVIHYMVRADNMQGKTLTVRRSTALPNRDGGNLSIWQMAWAYDPHGDWFPFDSVTVDAGTLIAAKTEPLVQPTVYIARRPVFTNSRWDAAIARWRASPHTAPTASGNTGFVIGTLPANDHAPAMPVYGFKLGTGPRAIFLSGNVHVDEHIGAYAYEALIDWLLGADPAAAWLRGNCTFYCYPKLNPQARYAGASRVEVTTRENANRIWVATGYDHIPLSKVMRDAWAADLPATVDAVFDFHDYAAGLPGRAAVYESNSAGFLGFLRAQYVARSNTDIIVEPTLASSMISSYVASTHAAPFFMAIEHGTTTGDDVATWQQWGRDVGVALRSYFDTSGNAEWQTPAWEPTNQNTTIAPQGDGRVVASVAAGGTLSPGASFPIPQGKTIDILVDVTSTNSSLVILRQGPDSSIASATSTELYRTANGVSSLRRLQRVTWTADRPFFGLTCARSNSSQASSFTLSSMVKYRVLP